MSGKNIPDIIDC